MSSFAFDKVVPFRQYFVLDDMPFTLTFKKWVAFFLCLICSTVDRRKYGESCFGSRPGGQFSRFFNGVENGTAPHSGNLREEPMLNGIPFGAVWWIVCNSDVDSQFLRSFNETPFELPASGGIRPTPVAEKEDDLHVWVYVPDVLVPLLDEAVAGELGGVVARPECQVAGVLPDIVDAVGHQLSFGERGIVMVGYFHGLSCVGAAVVSPEVAEEFLLLCVGAEHGNPLSLAFLPQLLDFAELFVSQLAVRHGECLYRLAAGVPFSLDDLPDGVEAHLYVILIRENGLDLRRSKAEPFRVGILRKPRYVELHYLSKYGYVLGVNGECGLPSPSLHTDPSLVEVLLGLKLMAASVDGIARDTKIPQTRLTPCLPFLSAMMAMNCLACLSLASLRYSISFSVTISAGFFVTHITAWKTVVMLRDF